MPITCRCRVCQSTRDLGPFESVTTCCSPECQAFYDQAVETAATGGRLDVLGIDPRSELASRIEAEWRLVAYRLYRQAYDAQAAEYEATRPRRGERNAVKNHYFPSGW
jgi:hypothetical protein